MNQQTLQSFFENYADGNTRKSQRTLILHLLKKNDFVSTASLRIIAYQYNARIFELRNGLHDNTQYHIESVRNNNKYGFVLCGWR